MPKLPSQNEDLSKQAEMPKSKSQQDMQEKSKPKKSKSTNSMNKIDEPDVPKVLPRFLIAVRNVPWYSFC